ncbi:MAG: FAD-dependent oxidoreductase [Burkholderiales bacterium]|nr:MAG: FAD-dependent oxidoreductase [Burkholderiales bacterium]
MIQSSFRFAVIGAGLAGLTAAAELSARGVYVDVFEKSRGVGGRMATRRSGMSPDASLAASRAPIWQCDHGAPAFAAATASFRAEVARWEKLDLAARWRPTGTANELWVGTQTMTAPARSLAASLPRAIYSSTTIDTLQREHQAWRLHSAEAGWHPEQFDGVILALPAPQASRLLSTITGAESPEQSIASHAKRAMEIAHAIPMSGTWAVIARFESRVEVTEDLLELSDSPLALAVREASKPARPADEVWLLHASDAWSDAHIEAQSDRVADTLLAEFREISAATASAFQVHRWRYAHAKRRAVQPVTEPLSQTHSYWDAEIGLGMCGDWLSMQHKAVPGGVEAAWLSGMDISRRVTDEVSI